MKPSFYDQLTSRRVGGTWDGKSVQEMLQNDRDAEMRSHVVRMGGANIQRSAFSDECDPYKVQPTGAGVE